MRPPTNNWRKRRTEHHFYAEIVTDITYSSSTEELLYILLGRLQNLTTNCPNIKDDVNTLINIYAKYLRDTARLFFSQDD
jgi:hypothetical protein